MCEYVIYAKLNCCGDENILEPRVHLENGISICFQADEDKSTKTCISTNRGSIKILISTVQDPFGIGAGDGYVEITDETIGCERNRLFYMVYDKAYGSDMGFWGQHLSSGTLLKLTVHINDNNTIVRFVIVDRGYMTEFAYDDVEEYLEYDIVELIISESGSNVDLCVNTRRRTLLGKIRRGFRSTLREI